VLTAGQVYYGTSSLKVATFEAVLQGHVVKISPALITITDHLVGLVPPDILQRTVLEQAAHLLRHKVRSLHVDVNFADYSGFAAQGPDINADIFTPVFLAELNKVVRLHDGFLTLHLLTDHPEQHLQNFADVGPGAVCFQLEVVTSAEQLSDLVDRILAMGACASPVIETVGSEKLPPAPPERVLDILAPALSGVGMLTLQTAGTASRSNMIAGGFAGEQAKLYVEKIRRQFSGTIQVQGGITTSTVKEAVGLGAEFLVAGTQIFRNSQGLAPQEVVDAMLMEAARALAA